MSAFLAQLKAYQESGTPSRCRRPWPHGGSARNGSPGREESSRELLQARASGEKPAGSSPAAPQLWHAPAGATARRVLPSQPNEKHATSWLFGTSHSIPTAIRPRLPLREIESRGYPRQGSWEAEPHCRVDRLHPRDALGLLRSGVLRFLERPGEARLSSALLSFSPKAPSFSDFWLGVDTRWGNR